LDEAVARFGRAVNPTILSRRDLARRVAEDTFVTRVLSQPKIWLIGGAHGLGI